MKNINKLFKTTIILVSLMVASTVQAQDYKYVIVTERISVENETFKVKDITIKTEVKGVREFTLEDGLRPVTYGFYDNLEDARKKGWENTYPRKAYIVRIKDVKETYRPSSNVDRSLYYYTPNTPAYNNLILDYELRMLINKNSK